MKPATRRPGCATDFSPHARGAGHAAPAAAVRRGAVGGFTRDSLFFFVGVLAVFGGCDALAFAGPGFRC